MVPIRALPYSQGPWSISLPLHTSCANEAIMPLVAKLICSFAFRRRLGLRRLETSFTTRNTRRFVSIPPIHFLEPARLTETDSSFLAPFHLMMYVDREDTSPPSRKRTSSGRTSTSSSSRFGRSSDELRTLLLAHARDLFPDLGVASYLTSPICISYDCFYLRSIKYTWRFAERVELTIETKRGFHEQHMKRRSSIHHKPDVSLKLYNSISTVHLRIPFLRT